MCKDSGRFAKNSGKNQAQRSGKNCFKVKDHCTESKCPGDQFVVVTRFVYACSEQWTGGKPRCVREAEGTYKGPWLDFN